MFSSSCCISHDATPWSHLVTWWHCDDQRFIKAHCYLCTCTAHIARHHSSNIDGNIVVVLRKYCCQCSNIGQISLWKDAQLLRDITRPILTKGFLSQTTGFRSMTKRLRKCWSFTLRTKAQGNDCGSDGKLKDLKIFRKAGSQQWPLTIFMCAKSFTFPRNFPRR